MRNPFRSPEAEPTPAPIPAQVFVVEELPLDAIPRSLKDDLYAAKTKATEAEAQLSAVFHRLNTIEQTVDGAIRDPSTGLDRVRSLERDVDRLIAFLHSSHNVVFERERPK